MSQESRCSHPFIVAALVLVASARLVSALAAEAAPVAPVLPAEGQAAILYPLPDLHGRDVDTPSLLKGKIGLIAFWASWCQPCVDEMPRLREVARAHRGADVVVLGVGLAAEGDTPAKQMRVAGRQFVNYLLLFDEGDRFQRAYNLTSLPYNLLVGADGKIRWQGAILPDDLDSRIKALLAAASSGSGG